MNQLKNRILGTSLIFSLFLYASVQAADYDTIDVPYGLTLKTPGSDVPDNCAAFFSETGWGKGKWNGNRPHELYVSEVRPDCSARVYNLWGTGGEFGPGYTYGDATIEGDTLTYMAQYRTLDAKITYKLKNGKLKAKWKKVGSFSSDKATLTPNDSLRSNIKLAE